ncbi:hypothetical protein [Desulfolithobacter sp.]
MSTLFISILFITLSVSGGFAAPDLGNFRDIEGVRVYGDNSRKDTWYLSPAPPALAAEPDGSPAYGLDIYRYLGRKGTGDQNYYWIRGVLSVRVERGVKGERTKKIRRALQRDGIPYPRLRSLPVTSASVTLVFADVTGTWQQGSRWKGRQIILPLDPNMAQLLWKTVEAGQTQLSITIQEQVAGVRKVKGQWQPDYAVSSWTIPVTMDMKRYPQRFRKLDIGGRMQRAYTGIDLFCFDFLEGLEPDLYAKIVEVAIPAPGRDLHKTVMFTEDGDYRARMEFELSMDLDHPYRFRIVKIFRDGRREEGPWQIKRGEAMLDITSYRDDSSAAESVEEDPEFERHGDKPLESGRME